MAFWFWIVAGLMYAKNHWNSQYFPIGSPKVYDNTGADFNVSRIMTKDATLDVEAYKNYSPLLQGPRIALAYALSFGSISCLLVHCALYDGAEMIKRLRHGRDRAEDDIHMREMRKYPEVPEWWFQVLLVVLFAISLAGIVAWPTFLPWWGFLLTMLFPVIFTIPIGLITARTSMEIGLNVITEFLAGYLWPGKPIANTLVKVYGYISMSKALMFCSDLKLGVYMKIPPRCDVPLSTCGEFGVQSHCIRLATNRLKTNCRCRYSWLINTVPDLCHIENSQGFTCPGNKPSFIEQYHLGGYQFPFLLLIIPGHCS